MWTARNVLGALALAVAVGVGLWVTQRLAISYADALALPRINLPTHRGSTGLAAYAGVIVFMRALLWGPIEKYGIHSFELSGEIFAAMGTMVVMMFLLSMIGGTTVWWIVVYTGVVMAFVTTLVRVCAVASLVRKIRRRDGLLAECE